MYAIKGAIYMINQNDTKLLNNVPILEVIKARGYTPQYKGSSRKGAIYNTKEADSLMIWADLNTYYRYSRKEGHTVIDFLVKNEGMTIKDACEWLRKLIQAEKLPTPAQSWDVTKVVQNSRPREFKLPEKIKGRYNRVFAYLTRTRCISKTVVNKALAAHVLYESAATHNCVFVCYDKDGNAKGASQRGTGTTGKPYKSSVTASDMSYPWKIAEGKGEALYVFESPIDAMSYQTLYPASADKHMIAINGVSNVKAIERYLDEHKEIKNIAFCFDNDIDKHGKQAGQDAAKEYNNKFIEQGYNTCYLPPKEGKDWNEYLEISTSKAGEPQKPIDKTNDREM